MDEIERLELQIEELRDAIERSRRFALAGRASVVAGPALLVAILLGLVAFTPARIVIALALAIGGMVLSGSSRATTEELRRALSTGRSGAERRDRRYRVRQPRRGNEPTRSTLKSGRGTGIRRPRLARGRPQGPPPTIDKLLRAAGAVLFIV